MSAWRTVKKANDTGRLNRDAVREAVIALRERRLAAEREAAAPAPRRGSARVAEERAEYGPES